MLAYFAGREMLVRPECSLNAVVEDDALGLGRPLESVRIYRNFKAGWEEDSQGSRKTGTMNSC